MPLYTYVVAYNDSTYVAQGSHSNFEGFISEWCTDLPINALNGFNSNLKNLLIKKAWSSTFRPVPNRTNVWKKLIDLDGKDFVILAIETKK